MTAFRTLPILALTAATLVACAQGPLARDQLVAEQGSEHVCRQPVRLRHLHGRAQAEAVAERRQLGDRAGGEFHPVFVHDEIPSSQKR